MSSVTKNIIETKLDTPISDAVQKHFPIGYYITNRYRGPIESFKGVNTDKFIVENLQELFNVYDKLSASFEKVKDVSPLKVENELQSYKTLAPIPLDLSAITGTIEYVSSTTFDKTVGMIEYKDITLTISGDVLDSITIGGVKLVKGVDYTE